MNNLCKTLGVQGQRILKHSGTDAADTPRTRVSTSWHLNRLVLHAAIVVQDIRDELSSAPDLILYIALFNIGIRWTDPFPLK